MKLAKASLALVNLFSMSALMLALALSAPALRAQQDDLASVDPTVVAVPAPQTIAPEAVMKLMQDKDPSIALVDTQPADGYADGHIPGAINYPWVMQIRVFPISLPRNKTLIFYGSCPNDTSDMIKQLAEYGYANIKVMEGGWYKWVALKYPAAGKGDYAKGQSPSERPSMDHSSTDHSSIDQSSNQQPAATQAAVAQVSAPSKSDKPATR